jgi:hypothetical protein
MEIISIEYLHSKEALMENTVKTFKEWEVEQCRKVESKIIIIIIISI